MLHPQVEIFLQVVECGSFSKAALIRSCSSVSIMNQINSLEARLGMRLLERTSRGVRLTDAGELFHREARALKNRSEDVLEQLKSGALPDTPDIRIGTSFLRPCKPFLDYLARINGCWRHRFLIRIVSFNDTHEEFARIQNELGKGIDCFASPCDSSSWASKLNIFQLGECECRVTLSMNHRLARKKTLKWHDLYGEKLMLVAKGISPVIDRLRAEILSAHPRIVIQDSPNYYDIEVFNKCAREEYLMETPQTWAGLHPALVTLPAAWDYALPYGVVYSKNPSLSFKRFIAAIGNGA